MSFSFLSYAVTQQRDSDGDGHESGARSVGEVMQCGKRSCATVGIILFCIAIGMFSRNYTMQCLSLFYHT